MWFNKKNKKSSKVAENSDFIYSNIAKAKVVVAMANDPAIKAKLEVALEELRYSSPSAREDVVKLDDKIDKTLDDIKIMLSAGKAVEKVLADISELDILIVRRKSVTEV